MESDIKRVIGASGKTGGKVVGRYVITEDQKIELHLEQFQREFRHMVEFALRIAPYSESELMKKDDLTFFRIVNECEKREREAVERLEKQENERS